MSNGVSMIPVPISAELITPVRPSITFHMNTRIT